MGAIKNLMGTKVQNPMRRVSGPMYKSCCHCGLYFTPLGLPRHWDKCPNKPKAKSC